MLYVLSSGPAFWLMRRDWLPEGARSAYRPILWLADRHPLIWAALNRYLYYWDVNWYRDHGGVI